MKWSFTIIFVVGLLTVFSAGASAEWVKTENGTINDEVESEVPTAPGSSYCTATNTYTKGGDAVTWKLECSATSDDESAYDDLEAHAKVTGLKVEDVYTKEGSASPHTFTCCWNETFDWLIQGDAEKPGFGKGKAEAYVRLVIDYDSGPSDSLNDYKVDFTANSEKTEGESWVVKVLQLAWDLYNGGSLSDLSWDDVATSDNKFKDQPRDTAPEEHSTNEYRSRYVYSSDSDNVTACATVTAEAIAKSLNDAGTVKAEISGSVVNFELVE